MDCHARLCLARNDAKGRKNLRIVKSQSLKFAKGRNLDFAKKAKGFSMSSQNPKQNVKGADFETIFRVVRADERG